MKQRSNWMWQIYAFLFSLLVLGNLIGILSSGAFLYTYYHILIAFDPEYKLIYYFAVVAAVVNTFALIPLFLYAFRIRWGAPRFWQWLFALRCVTDVFGHSYEIKQVQSFFADEPLKGFLTLIPFILSFLPSYIAFYRYAFQSEQALKAPSPR